MDKKNNLHSIVLTSIMIGYRRWTSTSRRTTSISISYSNNKRMSSRINRRNSMTLRRARLDFLLCLVLLPAVLISSSSDSSSDSEQKSLLALYNHRSLKDNNNNNNNNNNNHKASNYVDLSAFSLRFDKCQYVKTYDESLTTGSVFSMQHLVVFRMCPNDAAASIDSCGTCDENYGEYVVQASDYLTQIATHHQKRLQELCQSCKKYCNNNNNNKNNNNNNADVETSFYYRGISVSCAGCSNRCTNSQNLAAIGYVDAANFISCTAVPVYYKEESSDDESSNNNNNQGDDKANMSVKYYYVGPICSKESQYSKVTRLRIGVFKDENCWYPASGVNVEDLLGYKISYRNFRTNMSGGNCLTCEQLQYGENNNEQEHNNNKNNNKDQEVKDVCNNLYSVAAKCQTKHGFQEGKESNRDFENLISSESDACTYVDNIVFDSYNSYGEIETKEEQHIYERVTTKPQKVALLALVASCIAFVVYINFLHAEIDEGYPTIRSMLIGQGILSEEDSWTSSSGVMT